MSTRPSYTDINAKTWDRWAEQGGDWTIPITHEEYVRAQQGDWGVYLTPCKFVPKAWFGRLQGARLLGLASGGGQQMPIFAALGAVATIFDQSDRQLASERRVAEREGYDIEIVQGDMTQRLPFEDGAFDLIFHPVSNCYIEDVGHVWNECYRVLRSGGVLLAGFDNGVGFLIEDDREPLVIVNKLPFNPLVHPDQMKQLEKDDSGVQFSHSLEEQIGGQLKAGFVLTDLYEDRNREGTGVLREYTMQYTATRAVKP